MNTLNETSFIADDIKCPYCKYDSAIASYEPRGLKAVTWKGKKINGYKTLRYCPCVAGKSTLIPDMAMMLFMIH